MRVVGPGARRVVGLLSGTRLAPHHVVLTHTVIGVLAAWLLAGDTWAAWVTAAVLLQVKTLLDNVDGGLARATGRVTKMGRYLDTLMDLVVNAALFWALSHHGPTWLAVISFALLTLVLSAEFNAMNRHLEEHRPVASSGQADHVPEGAPPAVLGLLEGAYALILAPQDRLLRRLDEALFAHAAGSSWQSASSQTRRRWAGPFSTAMLVNLGLSTQMLALGIWAAISLPYAYVVLVLLQVVYVLGVQAWRVKRFRAGSAS